MPQTWILYPVFVMVGLSVAVGLRMLQLRVRAVQRDGLPVAYFSFNRGARPPAYLLQAEQHYMNLYETPVLFYAVVILNYVTNLAGYVSLTLAWVYVVARLAHACIHLGSNQILQRRNMFLTSFLCLVLMWLVLLIRLVLA